MGNLNFILVKGNWEGEVGGSGGGGSGEERRETSKPFHQIETLYIPYHTFMLPMCVCLLNKCRVLSLMILFKATR